MTGLRDKWRALGAERRAARGQSRSDELLEELCAVAMILLVIVDVVALLAVAGGGR